VESGAEALSVINTLYGMAVNVNTWKPMLANRTGGLSGPAIKPVALYMVNRVYTQVAKKAGIPIIGMGGVMDWRDAVEFFLVGASAVAVGTALFIDPTTPVRVRDGIAAYLRQRGLASVRDLVGQVR